MTEIKSTMDLVMERAARMGKATSEDLQQDEARKKGMQLIAEYLDNKVTSVIDRVNSAEKNVQTALRMGMVEGLLRNIFLPRDETHQARAERAFGGIVELGGGAGDVGSICQELQQILGGYMQHREELRGQLEEQVKMQYQQAMTQQGAGGGEYTMDPKSQQKFREEWGRIEAELTARYTEALEQHKEQLKERLVM